MLSVKQGSCEYQFYSHWFDLTPNQTRVYSSGGICSYYLTIGAVKFCACGSFEVLMYYMGNIMGAEMLDAPGCADGNRVCRFWTAFNGFVYGQMRIAAQMQMI